MKAWRNKSLIRLRGEQWLPIPKAKGYEISNYGRIKSLSYRMKLEPAILCQREAKKGGYLKIDLDKYNMRPSVHRLVGKSFVPNPHNKPFINHKDGDKQNNHYKNLEWVTRSENTAHAFRVLKIRHARTGVHGKDHPCSKAVKQIDVKTGKVIKIWESITQAANFLKTPPPNISHVLCKRTSTAKGFSWQYA